MISKEILKLRPTRFNLERFLTRTWLNISIDCAWKGLVRRFFNNSEIEAWTKNNKKKKEFAESSEENETRFNALT